MEKVKKVPLRKCMGCMETFPKKELIRVVRTPDGEVCIDLTGKKSGRGAYICKNSSCLKKAIKAKRLQSSLEIGQLDEKIVEQLSEELQS